MESLKFIALPSLVAAVLVPLIGLAVLFIERGSRRGLGIAGFLLLFGAAATPAFLMHNAPAGEPPADSVLRWAYALGTLAYLPVIEFLGDLARRSGAVRPLGLPLRVGQWTLRVLVVIGVPRVLWTDTIVAGTFYNPATGWETRWGWYWPGFVVGGAVFVAWGLACWNGQRRRCEQVDAELWAWLAALLLLIGMPIPVGTLLPASGIAQTSFLTQAFTVLGAIATLIGLVLSRDRELERLRPPRAAGPATRLSDTMSDIAPTALSCAACGASFHGLPEGGRCPLDGGAVDTRPDPLLGALIDGRYRVLRFLGAGGMARVYAAEHRRLGVRVAVKVLWGELAAEPSMTARFLREGRASSLLQSRYIARVHDVGELRAGLPYLVMELVEGISLGDLIDAVGPLRPESVARLGAQLAEGLSVAHAAGVIHRDLKPDNVMIVRGADLDVAKIVDFGVARLVDPAVTRLTATGSIFGTPLYMAPEQARGETAGPAADLYALGTLLYEAASGAPPFRADSPMRVLVMHMNEQPARVPLAGALGDLVMDLLAKDPSARPPSTGLADRFAVLAGGRPHIEPLGAVAATG